MNARSLAPLLMLALLAAGCGQALAPTTPVDSATRVGAAPKETSSPSPPSNLPDTEAPAIPSPCPSATLTNPRPNHLLSPTLPPTFTFTWAPNVPAAPGPTPTRYRYRVFHENGTDFDFVQLLVDPPSLLRAYAPGFSGWTEVSGAVTQATLHDLDPSQAHVLVLIAMDASGHFDNVVSFDRNALYFHVAPGLATDADRGTR